MERRISFDELSPGLTVRWEWNRNGRVYRALEREVRPIGKVVEQHDEISVELIDEAKLIVKIEDLRADGHRLWSDTTPGIGHPGGASDLTHRLRGIYSIRLKDADMSGEEKAHNIRYHSTSPIMHEAADRIDLLEDVLLETTILARKMLTRIESPQELTAEEHKYIVEKIKAAYSTIFPDLVLDALVPKDYVDFIYASALHS